MGDFEIKIKENSSCEARMDSSQKQRSEEWNRVYIQKTHDSFRVQSDTTHTLLHQENTREELVN